ncbi:MAG: response regulator [Planctomycetes bacterium]|nr:response regulator [Planctomycetota bacterium]
MSEPEVRRSPSWQVESALLRRLFPFGFSVDAGGRLVAAGERWATFAPQVALGASFDALFVALRPLGIREFAQLRTALGEGVLLKFVGHPGFELRGQFLGEDDALHFVGGPWLTKLGALSALGLELRDFPPHDTRGDLLVLLQAQETSLADMRALASCLREQIAAQTQLQAQLQQIQKMELVGRFAGGMAHNFNNILMAIQGYAELSLTRLDATDPVHGWVEQICAATEHAASLTHGLLTMSRQNPLKLEPLDLQRELRDVEKLVTPLLGQRVQLEVALDPAIATVHADSSSLKQVLMNLVLNARDAMPDGGRLSIAVRPMMAAILAGGEAPREVVEIAVTDTGIGMDERTKANIFEPFFTTKEVGKGVGLGLSTVYGLVQQFGGTIAVESQLGLGTTFRIRIPHLAKPAPTPAVATVERRVEGARVLLVDDEPQVRQLLEALLRRDGYAVSTAANAEEALALFEADERFELLLTDVLMPGLSGPEFSEFVEARHGVLPTVFISGHTDNARLRRGELPPHQRFLTKPFTPAELSRTLRELLAR